MEIRETDEESLPCQQKTHNETLGSKMCSKPPFWRLAYSIPSPEVAIEDADIGQHGHIDAKAVFLCIDGNIEIGERVFYIF